MFLFMSLYHNFCLVQWNLYFNAFLCKKVVGITNDFLQPCQNYSKMYGTEP